MQDTGRKKTGASQSPGKWDGTTVETIDGKVVLLVSQKKWNRGKSIVKRVQDELLLKGCLDFKQLERDRVFWFTCRGLTRVCALILRKSIIHWTRGEKVGMKMVGI